MVLKNEVSAFECNATGVWELNNQWLMEYDYEVVT